MNRINSSRHRGDTSSTILIILALIVGIGLLVGVAGVFLLGRSVKVSTPSAVVTTAPAPAPAPVAAPEAAEATPDAESPANQP